MLTRKIENKRLLHKLFHATSADFGWQEPHIGKRTAHGLLKEGVGGAKDAEGRDFDAAKRVHDELSEHFTLDAAGTENVRVPRTR